MRRVYRTLFGLAAACALAAPSAWAGQDPQQVADAPNIAAHSDNPSHPLGDRQAAQRLRGLQAKLNGKAKGKTHEVVKGQFVELSREGEDSIWTVVAQFGTQVSATYGGTVGPQRNQIPQPDRAIDN